MTHIMDIHTKCGDVAKQSGKKDLFPEKMTERQIKKQFLKHIQRPKELELKVVIVIRCLYEVRQMA